MGYLIKGEWHEGWYDTSKTGGEFVRADSQFRDVVTANGASNYPAEAGRYHLYVSLACPWAHRALIFRKLKQLEEVISVSVVDPVITEGGWAFRDGFTDTVNGFAFLRETYVHANPGYSGRVTVPVLWDKQTGRIVNNESAEIIRMLNSEFDAFTPVKTDFYPAAMRREIDEVNAFVYERINNGVYKAGFAGSQRVYESAVTRLFAALDEIEMRLGQSRYLVGVTLTEADWRLFTTLIRFDAVYVTHFKCNLRRIEDYPNLSNYLRDLYQVPGIAETVDFDHIKRHYFLSHRHLNPSGLVPKGPMLDYGTAHNRERLMARGAKRSVS
ncbi:glutathione S-transferase [Sulfuricaulis limicola]|uniref:Glutathione S-transferase n=1 Tax=Sulfuricaulis limicola TaxID=1620215 RepID=A0A1B4XCX1_9GAMM|nr:glutathione S-transferase family protein [Sulfuricaulis limicola]BAV32620.1 glutathione S-transferase [Sulfuricaulis limicola]